MNIETILSRALERDNNQILAVPHDTLRVYAQNAAGHPALVLELRKPLPRFVDSAKGFRVHVEEREHGRTYLQIASTDRVVNPAFSALCRHLLVESAKALNADDALGRFLDALEGFRALLSRQSGRLGTDEIRGLFAELRLLRQLVHGGMAKVDAFRAWNGPYGNSKDFVFPQGHCVEVKSAHRPVTQVRISSAEQLEAPDITLQLAVLPMERAGVDDTDAESFNELLDSIVEIASESHDALNMWESALEAIGLDIADPYYSDWAFACGELTAFDIVDGFPRIRQADVPAGVSGVSYNVSLASIAQFESPLRTE